MRTTKLTLALAVATAFCATAAWAGTDSSKTITVSTSVANNCIVAANSTLTFPAYDPVVANAATPAGDLPGTGTFQVRCTKGSTGVTIGMGLGGHAASGGTALPRAMIGAVASDLLTYHLYQPTGAALNTCGGTTVWGNTTGPGGDVLAVGSTFWSNSANKTVTVCGTIPGAQDVSADTYSDLVTITVNF